MKAWACSFVASFFAIEPYSDRLRGEIDEARRVSDFHTTKTLRGLDEERARRRRIESMYKRVAIDRGVHGDDAGGR